MAKEEPDFSAQIAGNFDLLFVNAGFSCRASLENLTEAIYDEMFNRNAKAEDGSSGLS